MKFLNHNLFTGDVTVSGTTTLSTATGVTRAASDNSTHLATTAFVKAQGYITSYTNNYITGLSFNTTNGVLTVTRQGLTNLTVDLDGRYLQSESDTLDTVTARGSVTTNSIGVSTVNIIGSTAGAELLTVDGTYGRLFTVTDDLSDSLFSVNTVAGLPALEVFADNTIKLGSFSNPIEIDSSSNIVIPGTITASGYNDSNWNTAYNDRIASVAVSGTTNKTLTLTQGDGGTVTTTWTDNFDNYGSWNLKTNSVQRTTVQSGGDLDLIAGTDISISYGAGGKVTIASTATGSVDYISNVVLNGSTLDFTGVGTAFTGSIDLSVLNPTVRTVYETVKNVSGAPIQKGTPLAVVAGQTSGNVSDVIPADASDPARMPAIFIANALIAEEAEGEAVLFGNITGVDTQLYASGTTVYVAPGGGWTADKPVYPNKIQNLGVITKQHATNGAGIVTGVGRANDLPNLTTGKIWVGTANYPIESTVVHVDEANGRLGIGTSSPLSKVHSKGEIRVDYNDTDGSTYITGYGVEFERGTNYLRPRGADGTQTLHLGSAGDDLDWNNINFKTSSHSQFRVAGSDVMRINSTGVGVGTTNPSVKLEIKTSTSDTTSVEGLRLYNAGGGVGAGVKIGLGVGATYSEKGYLRTDIVSGGAGRLFIGVNGSDKVWIDNNDVNISARLNVSASTTHVIYPALFVMNYIETTAFKASYSGNVNGGYSGGYTSSNSVGNTAVLARVSSTAGIINYAEYGINSLNGFVIGQLGDAAVKGVYGSDSLEFITASSTRAVINSAGNVGIGATSPLRKLHVVGDLAINAGTGQYYGVYINGTGEGANPSITIGDWHNASANLIWDSTNRLIRIDSQYSTNGAPIVFSGNDSAIEYARFTGTGNFGLGNNNPVYKLHAKTDSSTWGYRFENNTGDQDVHVFLAHGGGFGLAVDSTDNRSSTYLLSLKGGTGGANLGSVEHFRVTSAGLIGAGTNAPKEKLHVVGNVQIEGGSTSVVLETNNKAADPAGALFGEYDIATTYGAVVDYVIYDAGRDNMRSGTFSAVWNAAETRYNDVSTVDIGDTSVVTLTSQINGANVELIVTGDAVYTIKFNVKLIK